VNPSWNDLLRDSRRDRPPQLQARTLSPHIDRRLTTRNGARLTPGMMARDIGVPQWRRKILKIE
jgi:hypothetical protein